MGTRESHPFYGVGYGGTATACGECGGYPAAEPHERWLQAQHANAEQAGQASTDTTSVLGEIRDLLGEIRDAVKPPPRPEPRSRIARLGRVFSNGQIIPMDVDLVQAGNQRWCRIMIDGEPSDLWTPRDERGLELSSNDLLSRMGHVTEIPPPAEEDT